MTKRSSKQRTDSEEGIGQLEQFALTLEAIQGIIEKEMGKVQDRKLVMVCG